MATEQINQVSQGINRLLSQFKDKPNIDKILRSYLEQTEELECTWFELLNERSISTAIGVQLDLIGKIVVEGREGRNDTLYRQAILAKIGINNYEGNAPEIITFIRNLVGATNVHIFEHFPASTIIVFNGSNLITDPRQVARDIESVHAAGVRSDGLHDRFDAAFIPTEVVDFTRDFEILTPTDTANPVKLLEEPQSPNKVYEMVNDAFRPLGPESWKSILPEITASVTRPTYVVGTNGAPLEVITTRTGEQN